LFSWPTKTVRQCWLCGKFHIASPRTTAAPPPSPTKQVDCFFLLDVASKHHHNRNATKCQDCFPQPPLIPHHAWHQKHHHHTLASMRPVGSFYFLKSGIKGDVAGMQKGYRLIGVAMWQGARSPMPLNAWRCHSCTTTNAQVNFPLHAGSKRRQDQ